MPDEPQVPDPTPADTGYTSAGVPTFDGVREKIENRYGAALGATELAEEGREARDAEEQFEDRQRAAAEKLEQIRRSMRSGES
jgi:phage shock protein A